MRGLVFLMAVTALSACGDAAPDRTEEPGPALTDGLTAYRANKVSEAERIFTGLVSDPEAPAPARAGAARELARIAWLIDGEANEALAHLKTALQAGDDVCETNFLTARILRESGQHQAVLAHEREWLEACGDLQKRDNIRLQILEARLSMAARQEDTSVQLNAAAADLAELSEDGAGSLAGARARLEIGLLTGNAESALQGWRDYFWLIRTNMPQALEPFEGAGLFRNALQPDADDEARLALTELLMRAGFAQAAARYANRTGLARRVAGRPEWRRIAEYFKQHKRIKTATVRINRAIARGKDTGDELEQVVEAVKAALMQAANGTGDAQRVLFENYGLFGTSGMTDGYPSLHLGHVVEDRHLPVSQYGHGGSVRFIVLDNMLANGFQSWLWDGWAAAGGWATAGDWAGKGGGIVQVRPEYAKAPLRAWALLGDGPARRELVADHAEHMVTDLDRLKRNPVTYLPGVNDRLRLQVIDRIAAAARAGLQDGGDFRQAFLNEYYRGAIQHSIALHEGRHVIDKTLPGAEQNPMDSMQLEYRAKLSELALSDYPRLALRQINSASVGGTGYHGRANSAVLDLYRNWIGDHPSEIIGYDPRLPPLLQLDRLTDNQIRAIARSADPLAE